MYKLIRLANGRYFQGFEENGMIKSCPSPLDAKRFVPREVWYEEKELNEIKNELEDRVEFTIVILNYSIENHG